MCNNTKKKTKTDEQTTHFPTRHGLVPSRAVIHDCIVALAMKTTGTALGEWVVFTRLIVAW